MQEEYDALIWNGIWSLVPSSPGHNIVGNKWVFRIKQNTDGSIAWYKAQSVAKGFHQQSGIDFHENFSPMINLINVRTVLSITLHRKWGILQLDVNNVFLNGHLTKEVYMAQPQGMRNVDYPHHVCHLHNDIYGLKQAPRDMYQELHTFLLSLDFVTSHADSSLFFYSRGNALLYFLVYVNDLIITRSDPSLVGPIIRQLDFKFSTKDLRALSYFCGVEVLATSTSLLLSQQKYIIDLMSKHNMLNCKLVFTSLALGTSLTAHDGTVSINAIMYHQVVSGLQHLRMTRSNISFALNKLSQLMHPPSEHHWGAVKRPLCYFNGLRSLGIQLLADTPQILHSFSNAH